MHFAEQRMPSAEKKNKNKIGNESGRTVPNGDAGNTSSDVCEDSRDNAECCHCDAEPNTEKPRPDGNWRQVEDEEGVIETGNVAKRANTRYVYQTSDYDQASPNDRGGLRL